MMRLKEVVQDAMNLGSKVAFLGLTAALSANALEHIYDTPLMDRVYSFEECIPAGIALLTSYCISEMTEKNDRDVCL